MQNSGVKIHFWSRSKLFGLGQIILALPQIFFGPMEGHGMSQNAKFGSKKSFLVSSQIFFESIEGLIHKFQ